MTLQEMREKRQQLQAELAKLNTTVTERRSAGKSGSELWSGEEQKTFETLTAEVGTLDTEIAAEERADGLRDHMARIAEQRNAAQRNGRQDPRQTDEIPGGDGVQYGERFGDRDQSRQYARLEEQRCLALHAWACEGRAAEQVTDAHRQAMATLKIANSSALSFASLDNSGVTGLRSALRDGGESRGRQFLAGRGESRSIGFDANKQDWIPVAFRDAFELAFHGSGGILPICDLMITDSAEQIPWPFADDTANVGHQVDEAVAENLAGADAEMIVPKLGSFDFTSGFARIAKALLANSPFDIATLLGTALGERIARAIEAKLTTGNRVNTLGGFLFRSVQGATAPVAAPVAYVSLQALIWSIISDHRNAGTLVMHDQTLAMFAALVDGENRPLLSIGGNQLQIAKDVSVPYRISNYLKAANDPTKAAGDKIVAFGDFKRMKVRLVRQVRLERFNERFAEFHQAAFMANRSADGDMLRSSQTANCPIKTLELV